MYIRTLPSRLRETAEKELNEDSKRLTEDLQHIQEWIEKQPHLNARKGYFINCFFDHMLFNLFSLLKIRSFC